MEILIIASALTGHVIAPLALTGNCFLAPIALQEYQLTLGNIQRELGPVTEWFILGVQLDVPTEAMRRFEQVRRGDVERCKIDVLDYWMHSSEHVSWQGLACALSDVRGYDLIVRSLMRKEEGLQSALEHIGSGETSLSHCLCLCVRKCAGAGVSECE